MKKKYSSLKDGSVTGVAVSRDEMLSHCQTLNVACQYTEGEYAVCVLDYKREFGFWHGIQCSIFNGMHMIYVPYSIMKINPSIWLSLITKFKASVALVKSRDMHWGLMAQRDHKDVNLSSLRMLLVADGANPCSFLYLIDVKIQSNIFLVYIIEFPIVNGFDCDKKIFFEM